MDWNRAAEQRLRYVRVSLAGDGDSESVTALDAALDEIKRLERHKLWMEETSESEEDGWCPTHPRRFAVNARDDGDECQVCRAESAERELQAQRERADRLEQSTAEDTRRMNLYIQRIATLEAALRDTDATLDDSEYNLLLDCADGHQNRYRDNAIATLRAVRAARRLIRAARAAQPAQEVK